jgi:hypothetical protein
VKVDALSQNITFSGLCAQRMTCQVCVAKDALAALEERSAAADARLEDRSAELEDVLQARPARPLGSPPDPAVPGQGW